MSSLPPLRPGAFARVTFGPSAGTVVRLVRSAYAPPGCDGCAIHKLQPPGPVWVVDQWLHWDVDGRRLRLKVAPTTALRQIMVLVHPRRDPVTTVH